jgi:membrane associated rhomboid family serine protease/tetratricopeptide (TPR) repeat protein
VCGVLALPTLLGPDEQLGERLLAWGAKENGAIASGQWWRLLSAAFLHGDWFHLLFNMYALFAVGSLVERAYGRFRFIVIYILSAIGGAVASYFGSPAMGVGASGAIFGLMGAAMLAVWRGEANVRPLLHGRVGLSIAGWCLYSLLRGVGDPTIDNFAHVGGVLAGSCVALILPAGRLAVALATAAAGALAFTAVGVGRSVGMLGAYLAFSSGVAADGRSEAAAAEAAFTASINYPPSRLNRAALRVGRGEFAAALADLDTLLATEPRGELLELAHLNRAIALLGLSQPDAALASTIVVSGSSDSSRRGRALVCRGQALRALARPLAALIAWDSAAAYPDSGVVYEANFGSGEVLDSLGRHREAAVAYRAAGQQFEDAAPWLRAFWAHEQAGEQRLAREARDSALAVARRVVERSHETDARALHLLAAALSVSGQTAAASALREKARALDPLQ